jgi:hypothetical protein
VLNPTGKRLLFESIETLAFRVRERREKREIEIERRCIIKYYKMADDSQFEWTTTMNGKLLFYVYLDTLVVL